MSMLPNVHTEVYAHNVKILRNQSVKHDWHATCFAQMAVQKLESAKNSNAEHLKNTDTSAIVQKGSCQLT